MRPIKKYLLKHPDGGKPRFLYTRGHGAGMVAALELAEECESIAEFVLRLRNLIQGGKELPW